MSERDGFMDNEKLFDMIENLADKLNAFHVDLSLTRSEMKKYNGLRPAIDVNTKNIAKITKKMEDLEIAKKQDEGKKEGKKQVGTSIREWTAWGIAILSLIATISTIILAVKGVI